MRKDCSRPLRFLSLTGLTLLLTLCTLGQEPALRSVSIDVFKNQPAEIVDIRVDGKRITPSTPLREADDWLRRLSVVIKNTSDKPISYLSVGLTTYYERDGQRLKKHGDEFVALIELPYGLPPCGGRRDPYIPAAMSIPSGAVIEIGVAQELQEQLNRLLMSEGGSTQIRSVTLALYEVVFEGETKRKWRTGSWLERDANDPKLWNVISETKTSPALSQLRPLLGLSLSPEDPDIRPCQFRYTGDKEQNCTVLDPTGEPCTLDSTENFA